jgi:lipopolysaccharide transport system ATP-binding protein
VTDIAIKVEGLSKAYRLGTQSKKADTLVGEIARLAKAPLQNLRHLQRLNTFQADTDSPVEADDVLWALKDVSFEIEHGEVVGFIGRNGAGKSTLLKILSRITEPTTGRIEIHGRVSSLLEVGTGFHPELTGRENVYMNGTILGMKKVEIDRKFDEIVDFSGVERFLDTPVKRYSSGMKVRLAFSVAAHLEPELLIIDEVLAVGDAEFQKKCLGKMQDVAGGGRTVLFVSHNMAAVQNLCVKGVLLQQGMVQSTGKINDVIYNYLSSFNAFDALDIQSRTDREGDGSARVTSLWLEDDTGQRINSAVSGQTVNICIGYEIFDDDGFYFALGIYNQSGSCLLHNSTRYNPPSTSSHPRYGILICKIPRLPLPATIYRINTSIMRKSGKRADRLEGASMLEVQEGDFFRSGKIPSSSYGLMLCDHSWTIRSAN